MSKGCRVCGRRRGSVPESDHLGSGPPRPVTGDSVLIMHCPRCGLTIRLRSPYLTVEDCPRGLARAKRAVVSSARARRLPKPRPRSSRGRSSTAGARRRPTLSVIPIGRRRAPTQGGKRGGPATTRVRIIATSRTTGAANVLSGPSRCGSSPSRRDPPAGASCSVAVNARGEWGRTKLVQPLARRARLLSPASTASLAVCSVAGFRP